MISLYAYEQNGWMHLGEWSCMLDEIGFDVAYNAIIRYFLTYNIHGGLFYRIDFCFSINVCMPNLL